MSRIVRYLFAALIVAAVVAGGASLHQSAHQVLAFSWTSAALAQDQTQQPSQPSQGTQPDQNQTRTDINVTETTRHETVWYTNPVWIVLGVLALGVVIALIVAASKGGGSGTTVVGR